MNPEAVYLAVVLAGALVLFYTGWIRPDLTAAIVLVTTMLPWRPDGGGGLRGLLTPKEALSGFGSPAVAMVASMFVLSAAMVRTGAAQLIGRRLLAAGSRSLLAHQLTVLAAVTVFSSVVNDTTTVLLWMPMVMAQCRARGQPPSRVLMLVAFASLLGGQWTLIGTRSNIVVSDYLRERTGEGLGFFSFTPIAVLVWVATLVWFVLAGRRLLRGRQAIAACGGEHHRQRQAELTRRFS